MSFLPFGRRTFLGRLALGAAGIGVSAATRGAFAAPASGRPLGVALVGLGNYSTRQLAPALRLTKNCRLAGIVTGTPAKTVQWRAEYGLPEANCYDYESFDRIADNRDIDIVYVVTPNSLHREFVVRAARAGKHVICEKPMAVSVAECDEMIAACKSAGVRLSMGYRLHFDPSHLELGRVAREGDFGRLERIEGGFSFVVATKAWRQVRALAGGGPEMDIGVYVIQAACIAADCDPIAVTARNEPVTKPEIFDEVPETMSFTLEFPNGAVCKGRVSYNERANFLRAEGSAGWIKLEPAYSYTGLKVETSRGPFPFEPVPQQALQMDDFADCVRTGRPTRVPGEMGRRDNAILAAMHESARTGARVVL